MTSSHQLAPDRVLIVSNPSAGSRKRHHAVRALEDCLKRHKLQPEPIHSLDALGERAAFYQAGGRLRAVVAAGGDGTVAEVVNRTEPGVAVTVFPLGTANLLAGYLEIDADPNRMARLLRDGTRLQMDAGQANGRIFLLMVGCGFDAEVVHRLHRRREGGHISYWSYGGPILDAIRSYPFPELRVYCDPEGPTAQPRLGRWAFVVNLPPYAGGLIVAPDAVGTDGRLDVCTLAKGSLWHGLRYVGHTLLGRHQLLSDTKTDQAARVRIESDVPVAYQLDGDPGGMLPVDIEVLPGRLTLLAPRSRAVALGFQPDRVDARGA